MTEPQKLADLARALEDPMKEPFDPEGTISAAIKNHANGYTSPPNPDARADYERAIDEYGAAMFVLGRIDMYDGIGSSVVPDDQREKISASVEQRKAALLAFAPSPDAGVTDTLNLTLTREQADMLDDFVIEGLADARQELSEWTPHRREDRIEFYESSVRFGESLREQLGEFIYPTTRDLARMNRLSKVLSVEDAKLILATLGDAQQNGGWPGPIELRVNDLLDRLKAAIAEGVGDE